MNWISYALIAIIIVGFSDLFRKLASGLKDPFFANLIFQIGSVSAAIVLYVIFSRKIQLDPKFMSYAFIGGALISTFTLFSFKALSTGPGASTVLPVLRIGGISLAVVLSIFLLKEQLTMQKFIGLALSFFGVYLLFSK